MKPTLFICCCLFTFTAFSQQRTSFFITTELNRTKGLAALHSRPIARSNFAIGPGIEMIDISRVGLGGFMPFADVRYNWRQGKSTIMPLAQLGYNIWNANEKFGTTEFKGGLGYGFGLGYSYAVSQKGGGPYLGLKWRTLQNEYRTNSAATYQPMAERGWKISLGWRF